MVSRMGAISQSIVTNGTDLRWCNIRVRFTPVVEPDVPKPEARSTLSK